MRTYTTYVFDLDGTLTDTTEVWFGIYRDGLQHFGITPPEKKELAKHTHDWRQMLLLGLKEENLEDFTHLAYKMARERLPKAPVQEGAMEMLQQLQAKGKHIAIFSTLDRPIFEMAMQYRDLYQFAEVSIAGTDVPFRKPHPAGILKALEDLEIGQEAFSDAVYLGDKDTDIQAAHNAGVNSILYFPPSHAEIYDFAKLKEEKPTYTISRWDELFAE